VNGKYYIILYYIVLYFNNWFADLSYIYLYELADNDTVLHVLEDHQWLE